MKFKHNKKRNTAFLFEVLIRELTKASLNENLERKNTVVSIIKNYFNKNSVLSKELNLYKALNEDSDMSPGFAEKLLYEVKVDYQSLNKKKVFEAQSSLINEINKKLSKNIFSNFVPNYKNLATIYQILNPDNTPPKSRILLEKELIKNITSKNSLNENKMKPVDKLTMNVFVKKFNDQYSKTLLKEQQNLLKRYVTSFTDNGLELKIYLNEEVSRLKRVLKESLAHKSIQNDLEVEEKTKQVLNIIGGFRKRKVDSRMVETILKIQSLVKEI
jgi:hypothetical protein